MGIRTCQGLWRRTCDERCPDLPLCRRWTQSSSLSRAASLWEDALHLAADARRAREACSAFVLGQAHGGQQIPTFERIAVTYRFVPLCSRFISNHTLAIGFLGFVAPLCKPPCPLPDLLQQRLLVETMGTKVERRAFGEGPWEPAVLFLVAR